MTKYFNYHELTWPEVRALPRRTPLVIPVGEIYSKDILAQKLSIPPLIGLLPQLPFGWESSGLEVSRDNLKYYLRNLIASLQEDGFSNTYISVPHGIEIGLEANQILISPISNEKSKLTSRKYPPQADIDKVVIIPIGHTEQHGFHLPMSTDTTIINAIAQGVVETIPEYATTLPAFPYGVSTHRQSFSGTLNAGGREFEDFWLDVISTLVNRGFRKFYLMSGHGGNCSFLVNVVKYAGERHQRIFCATAWLYLSGLKGISSLNELRDSDLGGMGHAGELETSLILHLDPRLVRLKLIVDETDFITTPSYSMDWVEGGPLIANPPWEDDTVTGSYGAGSLGTTEKGKVWLRSAIEEKIDHVLEINDQHRLREARRMSGYGMWGDKIGSIVESM